MKKFILIGLGGFLVLFSCKKEENVYDVDVSDQKIEAQIINISDDLYNPNIPIDTLRSRYDFFFDPNVSNEVYNQQRNDSLEQSVYKEIKATINEKELTQEFTTLFKHIKYYYPKFESPKIYAYSSMFDKEKKYEPIVYYKDYNVITIALDYFLGTKSKYYQAFEVEGYLRNNMNPQNITPRVSMAIAETFPLMDVHSNQFMNYMIVYGKAMLLQDAFLPSFSDSLKIGFTQKQLNWCLANEKNMWDYMIRENYLYSDDKDLLRRFIYPAAFSKFFTLDEDGKSVDNDSPGRVGIWIGWRILRSYRKENPKVSLQEIMANRNYQKLFEESGYQPK